MSVRSVGGSRDRQLVDVFEQHRHGDWADAAWSRGIGSRYFFDGCGISVASVGGIRHPRDTDIDDYGIRFEQGAGNDAGFANG